MYQLGAALEAALSGPHTAVARLVCLWPDGTPRQAFDTVETRIVIGGAVNAVLARDVRRDAVVELANETGLLTPRAAGDLFAEGSALRLERGAILDGPVYAPLFTGVVDRFDAGMTGRLRLTCLDPMSLLDQPLGGTTSIEEGTPAGDAIQALWSGVLPAFVAWVVDDGGRDVGAPLSWSGSENRLAVGLELLRSLGLEAFCDRLGRLVVRPLRDPTTRPVDRTYRQGITSTILDLTRSGASRPVNMVRVIAEPPDSPPLAAVAEVEDPLSPIHRDRIGVRMVEYRSSALTTAGAALETARARLGWLALRQDTVAQSVVPDLAIDPDDIAEWELEARSGTVGRHRIDSVGVGLVAGATDLQASRVVPVFVEAA